MDRLNIMIMTTHIFPLLFLFFLFLKLESFLDDMEGYLTKYVFCSTENPIMSVLASLPPDILQHVSIYLKYDHISCLWMSGSSTLNTKLANAVLLLEICWDGNGGFVLPSLVRSFINLKHLVAYNFRGIREMNCLSFNHEYLPKSLESIRYRFPNSEPLFSNNPSCFVDYFLDLHLLEISSIPHFTPKAFLNDLPRMLRRLYITGRMHNTDFGYEGWASHLPPHLEVLDAYDVYTNYNDDDPLPQSITELSARLPLPWHAFSLLPHLLHLNRSCSFSCPRIDIENDVLQLIPAPLMSLSIDMSTESTFLLSNKFLPSTLESLTIRYEHADLTVFGDLALAVPNLTALMVSTMSSWRFFSEAEVTKLPPKLKSLYFVAVSLRGSDTLLLDCPGLTELKISSTTPTYPLVSNIHKLKSLKTLHMNRIGPQNVFSTETFFERISDLPLVDLSIRHAERVTHEHLSRLPSTITRFQVGTVILPEPKPIAFPPSKELPTISLFPSQMSRLQLSCIEPATSNLIDATSLFPSTLTRLECSFGGAFLEPTLKHFSSIHLTALQLYRHKEQRCLPLLAHLPPTITLLTIELHNEHEQVTKLHIAHLCQLKRSRTIRIQRGKPTTLVAQDFEGLPPTLTELAVTPSPKANKFPFEAFLKFLPYLQDLELSDT
jgi:hypothetical protein